MATIQFLDITFYMALPISLLLVLGGAWWVLRR